MTSQIILAIWTGVHPLVSQVTSLDPLRPKYNYTTCEFDSTDGAFMAVLAAFKAAIMVYGAFLAYKIRDVTRVLFNESKLIGFAVST